MCQEVDFDVEHPRNMNILNSLKKVKETEESENGKELTYTLIEDFNIVEEENEILADEEKNEEEAELAYALIEDINFVEENIENLAEEENFLSEDRIDDKGWKEKDVLLEDDSNVKEALQDDNAVLIFTKEEETSEDMKILEKNVTEEIYHDQKVVEEIFNDEKVTLPKKDGLMKRLTKCFFGRQSA